MKVGVVAVGFLTFAATYAFLVYGWVVPDVAEYTMFMCAALCITTVFNVVSDHSAAIFSNGTG